MLAAEQGNGLSLAEISRRLGVHKASCHSMLATLLRGGWLLRDPTSKAYTLGPAMLRLGSAAAARYPALDVARPAMSELAVRSGGHVIAFLVDSDHVTVAHQVRNVRVPSTPMTIGMELPTRPPYGAALVAFAPAPERERWLAELPADPRRRYARALDATRRRGYAVGLHVLPDIRLQELATLIRAAETSGREGGRLSDLADALTQELVHSEEWFLSSIAPTRNYDVSHLDAPVFDASGRVVLMLSLVPVPSQQSGQGVVELGSTLVGVTQRLSGALGGTANAG
jgi:DNA-binding IclR family transcriptional regulator